MWINLIYSVKIGFKFFCLGKVLNKKRGNCLVFRKILIINIYINFSGEIILILFWFVV